VTTSEPAPITVEAMTFGNDLTDAIPLDLSGWMVRQGNEVLFVSLSQAACDAFVQTVQGVQIPPPIIQGDPLL